MTCKKSTRTVLVGLALALVVLCVVLYFIRHNSDENGEDKPLEEWIYPEARRSRGAIASNGGPCAGFGLKILEKGGNAVDALITTMLCDGVTCMQNMGIGGGFISTIYIKKENKVVTLIARETAPAAADQNMFVGNKTLSLEGGMSIGVPGEILGYWEMFNKYGGGGSVKWVDLFEDTIKLCQEGVPVNHHLHRNIASKKDFIMRMPTLRKMLLNKNGQLPVFGDKIKLPQLAKTLKVIAVEGASALYNGTLTSSLVKDIKDNGGIITEDDMASYKVRWEEPVIANLSSGDTLYSTPLPGSGPVLAFMMKILDNALPKELDDLNTTFKITEAFKFAYGIRSRLGDPHYVDVTPTMDQINNMSYVNMIKQKLNVPSTSNDYHYYGSHYIEEDHGTANIVVFAPNGDAVSATSTINTIFGSGVVSESTGIILNNEMDDFSTPGVVNYFGVPPSPENFIVAGKRPLSSMAPSILIDKHGSPRYVAGAAGGTKITTATALAILRHIWFNRTTVESIRDPRFHHQLMPMVWTYEPKFNNEIVEGMKKRGHNVTEGALIDSCVTAISIDEGILGPSSDMRRPGNTSFLL